MKPMDPFIYTLYHPNTKGDLKQIMIEELNKPPKPKIAKKHYNPKTTTTQEYCSK